MWKFVPDLKLLFLKSLFSGWMLPVYSFLPICLRCLIVVISVLNVGVLFVYILCTWVAPLCIQLMKYLLIGGKKKTSVFLCSLVHSQKWKFLGLVFLQQIIYMKLCLSISHMPTCQFYFSFNHNVTVKMQIRNYRAGWLLVNSDC